MKKLIIIMGILVIGQKGIAQQNSKFALQVNYGLNGNFFVRSFDELGGPGPKKYFYAKNFVGSIFGVSMEYKVGKSSLLVADFARTMNLGRKNFLETINGVDLYIKDFRLQHVNRIVSLGYGYVFKPNKSILKLDAGFTIMYAIQQSIEVYYWDTISLRESNYKNSNAAEGGVFFGTSWAMKIDNKFDLGIKARIYYLISTDEFELMSLSPTLTYHFFRAKPRSLKNQLAL